ncbi:MAG TPA: T9SS type A sorting domain-containing protein [Candidatus Cloacimonas sp.]|nr:T9SS type A sorting domain-containing protein [Candidatus Cloacimonas sp.]
MKRHFFILFVLMGTILFATERGLTVKEIEVSEEVTSISQAVPSLLQEESIMKTDTDSASKNWETLQELNLNFRLPAKGQYGLQFMNFSQSVQPFGFPGCLSETAFQAVNKAPLWLQTELASVLAELDADKQTLWSNLILSTQDPYVDEICFCIAYSSPQYLNSAFALPELFTENAQLIYSIALELPYVEIIDTGTAISGGDYYSTTRYWKKDNSGQMQQITVPKELYYWYIVHLKLTDEIPAYINPLVIENNNTHNNNIAPPPTGKFWRGYLYNLQEGDYPVLRDTLMQCATLFNRDGIGNDAIRTIQWWINQQMSFTSNNERPHQPVRIITKHIGRCGEYADLTSAVARLALIPCTSILSYSLDHTWNEFWDENWVAWEPVNGYIDNPLVYENGWGTVFGSVFEIRPDGLLTPVTDRYSEGVSTIVIQVTDSNQHPVDGARVVLAVWINSNRFDCDQYTDNNGIATFVVGDNRNYRARVETNFGLFPEIAGTYTQLIDNSVAGETYQYILTIPAEMPVPTLEELPPPTDPVQDYQFSVNYHSDGYYITGFTLWDDIYSLGVRPLHYKYIQTPGELSFMVMDSDNILFWQIDNFGSGYSHSGPAAEGTIAFSIPLGSDWYAFIDNSLHHRNAVKLNGELLFQHTGTNVQEETIPDALLKHSSYPNPFNKTTCLSLKADKDFEADISVLNLKGQVVKSWQNSYIKQGNSDIFWDGKDNNGLDVSSGVYFWKVYTKENTFTAKILLLK